jgi:RNA polymerase sigma factor (TIGR02999 family)
MVSSDEITRLLAEGREGSRDALDRLLPLVYDELRGIASRYLRSEREDHTLQPTALVHEAYLRLVSQREVDWKNRAQFLGVAAQVMRRLLVDHARGHNAEKRGAAETFVVLDDAHDAASSMDQDVDVILLNDALTRLEQLDATQSRVVELRYFGGLNVEETAHVLGISTATVKREWAMARAWLKLALTRGVPS